jgi:hypothetical protein
MNHLFTRAGGVWADDTDLLHTEMADIDAKTVDSISATGGTYAITENLIIGGAPGTYCQFDISAIFTAGATVYGVFEAFGGVGMYDNVTIGSGGGDVLNVQSAATFHDAFTVLGYAEMGDTTVTGEFTATGNSFFNDPAYFFDNVQFSGGVVTANSPFDFISLTTFSDQATFYEQVVFQKAIVLTGEARIKQRQAIGGNADATYDAKTYTHVHCPAGTLSATRAYTIGDTGAQNGDRMRFTTHDTGFGVNVTSPTGDLLKQIKYGTGLWPWVDVERILGTWRLVGSGTMT